MLCLCVSCFTNCDCDVWSLWQEAALTQDTGVTAGVVTEKHIIIKSPLVLFDFNFEGVDQYWEKYASYSACCVR